MILLIFQFTFFPTDTFGIELKQRVIFNTLYTVLMPSLKISGSPGTNKWGSQSSGVVCDNFLKDYVTSENKITG